MVNPEWKELQDYLGDKFDPARCTDTVKTVADEFNRFSSMDEFYSQSESYLYDLTAFSISGTKESYRSLIRFLLPAGSGFLDYGCGIGSDGLKFIQEGYKVAFADFDNPSTRYLRWRLQQRKLRTPVYDIKNFPEVEKFDLAYAFDVLEHVEDPYQFLSELENRADYVAVNFIIEEANGNFPMHFSHPWQALHQWIANRNIIIFDSHIYENSQLIVYKVGAGQPQRPLLSVVIPTHNRQQLLEKVMHGLEKQSLPMSAYEVIVVNDGSKDGTGRFLRSYQAPYYLHTETTTGKGPAAARNQGVEKARAEVILFLDDDVIPARQLLENHLKFHLFAPAENCAALGHVDWPPDSHVTEFMQYITGQGGQLFAWPKIQSGKNLDYWFFYTCNLSVKKNIILQNRFDENFPYASYEDVELAYRLQKKGGLQLRHLPAAKAYHYDFKNYRSFKERQTRAGFSAVYFSQKHPKARQALGVPENSSSIGNIQKQIAAIDQQIYDLERKVVKEGTYSNKLSSATENQKLRQLYGRALRLHYVKGIKNGLEKLKNASRQKEAAANTESIFYSTAEPTHTESPKVSVIIPVFNQAKLTHNCLENLYNNTNTAIPYEVIIIDNASTDETPRQLRTALQKFPHLKVITNSRNLGFARACNQGAREARGAYILLLNNDTEPLPGWMGALLEVAENDPNVAAVGSKMLFPDHTIQHAGVALVEDRKAREPIVARHIYYKRDSDFPPANQLKIYQALTAACLLVRKTLFDDVSGFDEGYWNGYEDVDLCFKFGEKRWKLVYQPKSVLIHYESQSGPERFSKVRRNVELLYEKWVGKIKPDFIIQKNGKLMEAGTKMIRNYPGPAVSDQSPDQKRYRFKVSIIILTLNQLKYTKECLESIDRYTEISHEIIVIDNHSTDGTVAYLKKWAARKDTCKVILNKENAGFAAANNQGIRQARGRYILLMNNDVVVTPGWLSRLLAATETYPDVGLAGPMTNYISGDQMDENAQYSTADEFLQYAAERAQDYHAQITETFRLVGFCLLINRQVIQQIGLLVERFGRGNFEDDDYCVRAGLAGFKMVIVEDAFVHHYGNRSFKGNKIDYGQAIRENRKIFFQKWKNLDQPNLLWLSRLLEKARIEENDGNLEEAWWALKRAYQLNPGHREIHKTYLKFLGKFGNEKEYLSTLQHYVRKYPFDSEALNLMGVMCWQLNRMEEAIKYFERAVVQNGEHSEHLKNLADAYLTLENFEDGIKILTLLMQKFPEDPEPYLKMADLYFENGDYENAQQIIQICAEKNPGNKQVSKILELIDIPQIYLAYKLIGQGEREQAQNLFEEQLKQEPNCKHTLLGLGSIYFNRNQFSEAGKFYDKVLEIDPHNEEALYFRGKRLLLEEEFDLFNKFRHQYKSQFKNSALLQKTTIEFYIKNEAYRDAVSFARDYLQRYPEDVDVHILLGNIHYQLGNLADARKNYVEALRMDPGNETAKENIEEVTKQMAVVTA